MPCCLFVRLAVVTFVVFFQSRSVFAESPAPVFAISTIQMGEVRSQTVLSAFLNADEEASLVVLTVSRDNERKVMLFQMTEGLYQPPAAAVYPLPDDVILADVGRLAAHEVVVLFGQDTVWKYDPYTGKRSRLISIASIYGSPIFGSVPKMDFFRDLNGDGLDDFIIPGFSGFQIFVQTKEGNFAKPLDVKAPPTVDISYNNFPWYQPRNIFNVDMTGDSRDDLVFWVDGMFSVFRQLEDGTFDSGALRVKPGVDFEFDGMEGMSIAMQDEDQSDNTAKALFQLTDLDADSVPDIVTLSITSEGVFKKTTTYEIYKGVQGNGMVEFSQTPDARIDSGGIQFEMVEKDFNRDGQTDMVISTVEIGIGKILTALITGSINIDLNFYQMTDGTYPGKPVLKREMTATFSLSSGDVFFPSVLIDDVDGDQVDDLMVQEGEDKLRIFMGGNNGKLFARKSVDIDVSMPNEPDLVEIADLNGDGKSDILMRHQAAGKPRKIVVMVSQ